MTRERLGEARQKVHGLESKVARIPEPRRPSRKAAAEAGTTVWTTQEPLQIGDTVRVLSFGQNAELLGLTADRSEADVQMGALRIRVSVDNLERLSKRQAAATEERTPPAVGLAALRRPPGSRHAT